MTSDLNVILFILIGGGFAALLDLALILAWRRRNQRKKQQADAPSIPASPEPVRPEVPADPPTPATANLPAPEPEPAIQALQPAETPHAPLPPPAPPESAAQPGATTHVQLSVDLHAGETIRVTIESLEDGAAPVVERSWRQTGAILAAAPSARPGESAFQRRWTYAWAEIRRRTSALNFGAAMLALALTAYLLSRVIGLTDWPIYFFTDEAIQTNQAADFLENGFDSREGDFFPTYFTNGGQYNLGVSVYAQALPYILFGKSDFATRFTSVLFTVAGAAALGLMLRDAFRLPVYWAGVLILGVTPAWFLHSRTAFEVAEAVSLYAVFLYLYLQYRTRDARFLFPALLVGGLCFYTYSPAQLVIVATGVFFLFSDIRYHWQHRLVCLIGLAELLLLVLPYARFQIDHPNETLHHLVILRSYWIQNGTVFDKLGIFFGEYLRGLSPLYWFNPASNELVRHVMKGYGNILLSALPFALIGLAICLRNFRQSPYRAVVFALLASPAGGALASTSINRALFYVVPAALLTTIGLSSAIDWLARRFSRRALEAGLMAGLLSLTIYMTADALTRGPTWFSDYTLYGLQYGGRQLTTAMQEYLKTHADTRFVVTPTWANGTDEIMNFFLPRGFPYRMDSIDSFLNAVRPLTEKDLLIMTPEEYNRAIQSQKFSDIRLEQTLPWPDGRPGFYFVRLRYAEDAGTRIAREQEDLKQPVEDVLHLNGEDVRTVHSQLDMGDVLAAFDDDVNSLMRGLSLNPLTLEMYFPAPRRFSSVRAMVGAAPMRLTLILYPLGGGPARSYSASIERATENHEVILVLPETLEADHIRLEFFVSDEGDPAHVHIYEITLEGPGWISRADAPGS